jgi:hypothetical protein
VDPTVIHNNNRVGSGKWLHPIEETAYEALKGFSTERAFNNFTVQDAIIARDSRKDRETGRSQKEMNMNECVLTVAHAQKRPCAVLASHE